MSDQIRLASVNIQNKNHLELVMPFIEELRPDVLCLQEVLREDMSKFENIVGKGVWAGMNKILIDEVEREVGVGIVSRLPIKKTTSSYYDGDENLVLCEDTTVEEIQNAMHKVLLSVDVEKGDSVFRIGTTHFTWTPDGAADDRQREDLKKLFSALDFVGDIVFCGDFNAPRGGEIFSAITKKYKDNIPVHYTTSIDASLHRAGALPHMVDGLFSTEKYQVSDVEMVCGISDHCGLIANVSLVNPA